MSENLTLLLLTLAYYTAFCLAAACAGIAGNLSMVFWSGVLYWATARDLHPLMDADIERMKRERGEI